MSLLDNASLLLTPNAYKEGKLYSVIPSNGNGDFTATRATTATRVNSAGLVDLVPYNLVQYSDMFSDSSWAKNNSTITANTTTAPNGTLTADTLTELATTAFHGISQNLTLSAIPYTFSFYAKPNGRNFIQWNNSLVADYVNFNIATGAIGSSQNVTNATAQSVGNGWYRCSFQYTATASTGTWFRLTLITSATSVRLENYSGDGTSGVFLWGAQLVEGTSARDYLRTETRLNIPRVDYSLGGCPNILLEPQRTNLALQSSSFDNASWTKTQSSVTANSTTSPSGITDADTYSGDGTLNVHTLFQAFTVTNGVNYSWSFYAKKNTNNFIQLNGSAAGFGVNVWANFDLNNGVVGSVGLSTTASIQSVGNGWYRCTIVGAAIASTSTNINLLLVSSATSIRGESNTLSTSVFLWGAQLEAGAYATSFIPTTTASVTRNADSISLGNVYTNGLISASGGTWFVELRNNVPLTRDTGQSEIYIGEDSASGIASGKKAILIRNNGGPVRNGVSYWNGSALTILYTTTTSTCKLAIKFNGTTLDVFENGIKVVTSAIAPLTLSSTQFFNSLAGTTRYINQMALWATPLTDTQLTQLTTL